MPAWTNNPFGQQGNWYGGTNVVTGDPQDYYNTPLSMQNDAPYGEYERWLTAQGYGGFDRQSEWGRGMFSRARSGYEAAELSNNALTFRDYLNQHLGTGALDNAYAALSARARGDNTPGQTRRIMWG